MDSTSLMGQGELLALEIRSLSLRGQCSPAETWVKTGQARPQGPAGPTGLEMLVTERLRSTHCIVATPAGNEEFDLGPEETCSARGLLGPQAPRPGGRMTELGPLGPRKFATALSLQAVDHQEWPGQAGGTAGSGQPGEELGVPHDPEDLPLRDNPE